MKRLFVVLACLALGVLLAGQASAQESTSDPGAEAAFLTVNLKAGFPLDPFIVSVNGGGDVAAEEMAPGCAGYVPANPTAAVMWEGETELVRAFFHSTSDATLLVQTPDGEFVCGDDANALLLDPVVNIAQPAAGRYAIWVGSYDEGQLIPGVLVLTTRSAVTPGAFRLRDLIDREPMADALPTAPQLDPSTLKVGAPATSRQAVAQLAAGGEPVVAEISAAGEQAAFEIALDEGALCNGFVNVEPDAVVEWSGQSEMLRIFFEGDQDATLVVALPSGEFACSDDASPDNLNPQVQIADPAEGRYSIFVGRLNLDEPVQGQLTVTDSAESEPDLLTRPDEQ